MGPPVACTAIKLVDVPEMNYFAEQGRGEVCFRGPNVFVGYLNNPEKTAEALDADGWLHSGDIGEWTPAGALRIIDRKKNIFKLAQGEYIAPEKIEAVYARHSLVAQAYVHGDSLQASLVAVMVPDAEPFLAWATAQGFQGRSLSDLCADPKVVETVLSNINGAAARGGLKSFEQVKGLYLHAELFSIENGLLTPTFKSKRPTLQQRFAAEIARMYDDLARAAPPAKL